MRQTRMSDTEALKLAARVVELKRGDVAGPGLRMVDIAARYGKPAATLYTICRRAARLESNQ